MIVYKAINKVNGKCYVGITTHSLKRRKWQHLSIKWSGTAIFSKAIVKYGKDNFIFEKIDNALNEKELLEKEEFWIKQLNTLHPNGYNFLQNNSGKEITKSRSVKVVCLEDKKVYDFMSDAATAYGVPTHSVWCVCSGRTDRAGKWAFEYVNIKKKDIANKRREKRKINADKGYRIGYNKTKKPVKCVETGITFDCGKNAGKILNINPSQITRVCMGKNETAGGYHFIYVK